MRHYTWKTDNQIDRETKWTMASPCVRNCVKPRSCSLQPLYWQSAYSKAGVKKGGLRGAKEVRTYQSIAGIWGETGLEPDSRFESIWYCAETCSHENSNLVQVFISHCWTLVGHLSILKSSFQPYPAEILHSTLQPGQLPPQANWWSTGWAHRASTGVNATWWPTLWL